MTDTITREIVELEELLDAEIPCGGNLWPKKRPCPNNASATWVTRHGLKCTGRPMVFKCDFCLAALYQAHEIAGHTVAKCQCGLRMPIGNLYSSL